MSKYFTYIFFGLLLIAGVLIVMATNEMESRLQTIESQIDKVNVMLKDMTNE